jgi:hypothetical protein
VVLDGALEDRAEVDEQRGGQAEAIIGVDEGGATVEVYSSRSNSSTPHTSACGARTRSPASSLRSAARRTSSRSDSEAASSACAARELILTRQLHDTAGGQLARSMPVRATGLRYHDVMRRYVLQADDALLERAREVAHERGVSMAQVVRDALEKELGDASAPQRSRLIGAFESGVSDNARKASRTPRVPSRPWR